MLANPGIWKRKREELTARREAFLQRLSGMPDDPGVASPLRVMEEAIAECTKNIERGEHPKGSAADAKNQD